jgi:hypothetical protein
VTKNDTTVTFTRDEIIEELERLAKQSFKLSLREFVVAYREHRLPRRGPIADLLVLLDLLPEDDPLFAPV